MPYESMGAVVVRFGVLNGITAKDARIFIGQAIGQEKWWSDGLTDDSARRLAQLLDEPEEVALTLIRDRLDLPSCFGGLTSPPYFKTVTYCPVCRRMRYHAVFHEYPWLDKCLIHGEDLIRQELHSGGFRIARMDAYDLSLWDLFDGGTGLWLRIMGDAKCEEALRASSFKRFLEWIHDVQDKCAQMDERTVDVFWGGGYALWHLDILLGRLDWMTPIPTDIQSMFAAPIRPQSPEFFDCPLRLAKRIREKLKTRVTYWGLSNFIRTYTLFEHRWTPWRTAAQHAIEILQAEDKEKQSSWGWLKRVRWVTVAPEGWPYWQVTTPRQEAIKRLTEDWGGLPVDDNPSMYKRWYWYLHMAFHLSSLGLLSQASGHTDDGKPTVPPTFVPLLKLELDPELQEYFDFLLCREAVAEIENLRLWLKTIDEGCAPDNHTWRVWPHGRLIIEPRRAYLITWKAEAAHPPPGYEREDSGFSWDGRALPIGL